MNKKTPRIVTASFRLSKRNFDAALLVAPLTCRSLSELYEYALQRFIEHNYPEAYTEGAVLVNRIQDAPGDKEKSLNDGDTVVVYNPLGGDDG